MMNEGYQIVKECKNKKLDTGIRKIKFKTQIFFLKAGTTEDLLDNIPV